MLASHDRIYYIMDNYPKVSIIVLNWNGLKDTIDCLESVKRITYPNYEIIVVDNASSGDDVEVLKEKFGNYIYIIQNDKNYNCAGGRNIGIRHVLNNSIPDYILLLDNDTVVHPQFLNEMVEVAKKDCSIAIAGPKTYFFSNGKKLQFTTAKIHIWTGHIVVPDIGKIDSEQYNDIQDTDYCQGSCFLMRREIIEKIGLFDTTYAVYFEETDYCLRAKRAGFRNVYCPRSMIWHKQNSSTGTSIAVYYLTRNKFLFMKNHASRSQRATFLLYYFAFDFWVTGGHFLIRRRSIRHFISFLIGVKDGIWLFCS